MSQLTNYVISGQSRTGKTTYVKETLASDPSNSIILSAVEHQHDITNALLTDLLTKRDSDKPLTVVIDELNYGAMPTHTMQGVVSEVSRAVNEINQKSEKPLVDTLAWIGSRNTLIKLVNENMIYNLMSHVNGLVSFDVKSINCINGLEIQKNPANDAMPFQLYELTEVHQPITD